MKQLKKILKNFFHVVFDTNYHQIENKIKDADVVSFDIFDTVIKRDVQKPKDVFLLVEEKFNEIRKDKIAGFQEERIIAEKKARENTKEEEVTLSEIYDYIGKYSKEEKKELLKLELEIEKKICTKNLPMYSIYQKCVEQKKMIFFISDIYLPIELIKEILESNGYTEYEKLYVSSDKKLSKASGNLFKCFLEENHISKKRIVHIGDHPKADFIRTKKYGIKSILISQNGKYSSFESKNNSLDYNILSTFINNRIGNLSDYEAFGYEVLGPILYSFTTWIHQKIKEDKIDKIYFLARDAKIIKEVYEKRFNEKLPIYYIKISRKSVVLANLEKLKDFDDMIYKIKSIIRDFSKVSDVLHVMQLDNLKVPYQNKILNELTIQEKEEIFKVIRRPAELSSKIQKEYFTRYLSQNNFTGNIALVDIGWNGTIQYYLDKYTSNDVNLYGYYYGIDQEKKYSEYQSLNRFGFLYDDKNNLDFQIIIRLSLGLFETMFLSTEKTTIGYQEKGEVIEPIYGNQSISNKEIVKQMQDKAKQFVQDVEQSHIKDLFSNIKKEAFFENYKNLSLHPTFSNIKLFKNIEFEDVNATKLVSAHSLMYYLFHLKNFYLDFRNSSCKAMFLKQVFKFNVPYSILRRLFMHHNKVEER